MLMTCPECELQVSDKAITCPHCGFPIDKSAKNKRVCKNSERRKRLPNGFGQITKMNNKNLRKPYRAMVTVGKNEYGKPICKLLKPESYFKTYNDAYAALVEYNKNPYDLESLITVEELYNEWSESYFKTLSNESSKRSVTSAWNYCSAVKNMRVKDLRARHIKGCMEDGTHTYRGVTKKASASTKTNIKSMFNLMLDYALEYEIVDRNYARTFNISDDVLDELEEGRNQHIPFKDDEMKKLWDNLYKVPYVDIILIQCYSGWRPQELGLIELTNTDLDNWTFTGGMKTKAGKGRTVPIHSRIKELVKKRYEQAVEHNSKYLFICDDVQTHRADKKLTYDKYSYRFSKAINELGLNPEHRPHDPRSHFITQAKKAKINDYEIKQIVGHSIKGDVTEYVYTHRDIEWIRKDIELIP